MTAQAVLSRHTTVGAGSVDEVTRLLVCWQHPETRRYHAAGLLTGEDGGFGFNYLRRAADIPGFRPFVGFSRLARHYRSMHLFPLFAERVMDSNRPDRPRWLDALALPTDATPLEVLARSGGHRPGDTIELLPVPTVDFDGLSRCVFLAHGVRHQPGASERITGLRSGDRLALQEDSLNPVNASALLVMAGGDGAVGYVPDPLLDHVHAVRAQADSTITVVRANGPEVGHHLRLLVRLEGRVPAGYQPCTGPGWELASDDPPFMVGMIASEAGDA